MRWADLARQAGVDVEIQVSKGMQRGFYFEAGNLDAADEDPTRAGAFLDRR